MIMVFAAICMQIVLMTLFSSHGGISPDSANYLRFALQDGMHVGDVFAEKNESFFAVWPVGYPMMIRVVHWLLPWFDVLVISKIVNIMLIGVACVFIHKTFGKDGYLYAMLFLADSFVRISYMTWSEVPFSIAMLIFSMALYCYGALQHKGWLVVIFGSALMMFLARYIGLFALVPLAVCGLIMAYQKQYQSFYWLAACGCAVLAVAGLYLWNNFLQVGSVSGVTRLPAMEKHDELLSRLVFHQFKEMKHLLIVMVLAAAYWWMSKTKYAHADLVQTRSRSTSDAWKFFLLVGLCYWIAIVAMRWNFHFDVFDNRLLGPATLLFLFALLNYLLQFNYLKALICKAVITLALISLVYHIPFKIVSGKVPFYPPIWETKMERYRDVMNASIILFADLDVIYYHPNAQPAAPFHFSGRRSYSWPMAEDIMLDETLAGYATRLCETTHAHAIYVDLARGSSNYKAENRRRMEKGKTPLSQFIETELKQLGTGLVKMKQCK